jgi:ribosomal protein L23
MKKNDSIKFAVFYLADQGKKEKAIGSTLGVSVEEVNTILKNRKIKKNTQNNISTTSSSTKKNINSRDLMITETSVKGTKSVAIMTKAASELNDEYKKALDKHVVSRTSKNAIHRPKK